ncbi:hypothetical protein [Bacillus swezeyi]|uniref:hypothetical protein n=1 Tax=Bacillus swezeyi TaxID=1925020 RepID=UPI0027DB8613|nr:hypothetical protein [Bacillus swezeyi]
MNEKLAKEKSVMNYLKKIEREGGFGNSLKGQNEFKKKLKEKKIIQNQIYCY